MGEQEFDVVKPNRCNKRVTNNRHGLHNEPFTIYHSVRFLFARELQPAAAMSEFT